MDTTCNNSIIQVDWGKWGKRGGIFEKGDISENNWLTDNRGRHYLKEKYLEVGF